MIMKVQFICAAMMTVHALPIVPFAADGELPTLPSLPSNNLDTVQEASDYGLSSDINIPYTPAEGQAYYQQEQLQQQQSELEIPQNSDDVQQNLYYQLPPATDSIMPSTVTTDDSTIISDDVQQPQLAMMSLQGEQLQSSTVYGGAEWQAVYNSLPSQEQSTDDYYAKMGI